jgi:hypothetical protein
MSRLLHWCADKDRCEICRHDAFKEIVDMQFKVLARVDKMLLDNNVEIDSDFKKRVFENIKYIEEIERLIIKIR